jgi:hypothetical protein
MLDARPLESERQIDLVKKAKRGDPSITDWPLSLCLLPWGKHEPFRKTEEVDIYSTDLLYSATRRLERLV